MGGQFKNTEWFFRKSEIWIWSEINNMQNVILLDTDAAINFFSDTTSEFHKEVLDYKKQNNAIILVTFFTWYELFQATTDVNLIKKKLRNLLIFSDGLDIHTEIDNVNDKYFNPEYWLNDKSFNILGFNQFIISLKKIVYDKVHSHVMDTLLVSLYTVVLFDHILDFDNPEKTKRIMIFKDFIVKSHESIKISVIELLKRHMDDKKYFEELLFELYKGFMVNSEDYCETQTQFINRIKKTPYSKILLELKKINKKMNNRVKYDLSSKEQLLESIYHDFYDAPNSDLLLKKSKIFAFQNSPIAGKKFDLNDYIDLSNLLLSQNTPGATIKYFTNDDKWLNFIDANGIELGII